MRAKRTGSKMHVGEVFRYGRPYGADVERMDGMRNYFHVTSFPGHTLPLIDRGINPIGYASQGAFGVRPAILISSSPHKIGSETTPWQDYFDPDHGHIRYFGDSRKRGIDPATSPGNRELLVTFELHHAQQRDERMRAIPLLYFRRVRIGNRAKGNVQFQGFGIIHRAELVAQYVRGAYFVNYAYDFVVFNLEAEGDALDWTWINQRRSDPENLAASMKLAPASWRLWVEEGEGALRRCRRQVSRLQTTSVSEQKPLPGSREESALKQIYDFYKARGEARFELLAAEVAGRVIDPAGDKYQFGWITPSSSDGGADFVGRLDVGSGFSKVKLIVLGQAKCERPTTPTNGRDIARTVARLKSGWIGVYVTTSYVSEPAQREIIDDRYPILCIHGLRLAEEVDRMAFSRGYKSVVDFLVDFDTKYEDALQFRRPEELLQEP